MWVKKIKLLVYMSYGQHIDYSEPILFLLGFLAPLDSIGPMMGPYDSYSVFLHP